MGWFTPAKKAGFRVILSDDNLPSRSPERPGAGCRAPMGPLRDRLPARTDSSTPRY